MRLNSILAIRLSLLARKSSWVAKETMFFRVVRARTGSSSAVRATIRSLGGYDRQAGDLIWGGTGDDIYQVLPDRLPATRAAQRRVGEAANVTYIPTFSDRFDGEAGNDQVLYLGGDLDINGRVVPDNMAIRWNTILHRYEITSQVWNFQSQQFEQEALDSPAEIIATLAAPTNGQLKGDFELSVAVNGATTFTSIKVLVSETLLNSQLSHLVFEINDAIRTAGLRGQLTASSRGGNLVFTTIARGAAASLQLKPLNQVTADLGLGTVNVAGAVAQGQRDQYVYQQNYAFYTTFNTEQTVIDGRRGDDEIHADPNT